MMVVFSVKDKRVGIGIHFTGIYFSAVKEQREKLDGGTTKKKLYSLVTTFPLKQCYVCKLE